MKTIRSQNDDEQYFNRLYAMLSFIFVCRSNGEQAPCQPVLADPVQTQTNELYYKFCTETRYHPIRRSAKHSTLVRRSSLEALALGLTLPRIRLEEQLPIISGLTFDSPAIVSPSPSPSEDAPPYQCTYLIDQLHDS